MTMPADEAPRRRRERRPIGPEVALTATTAAVAYSSVRLFTGTSFLWPLLAVVVVAHGVAALGRRWHWPALPAGFAVVGASFLAVVATRYRAGSFLGLPTPAVLSHMRTDLDAAATAFRTVRTPTTPLPGFVLALALGVALVVVAADALAFRLRARSEALVPAAGLFVFGAILGGDRLRLTSTALFAAGALLFVLLDRTGANRSSERWVIGDRRGDTRSLLQAGSVIAVATCLFGVAVATTTPNPAESPWTRWRGADDNNTRVTVSPLVDLRERLVDQTNVLLFTVQADRPAYWRLTSLDDYDNGVWSSNNSFSKAKGGLDHPAAATHSSALTQRFSLLALAQVWAPAAFQPTHISGTDKLLFDPGSATLIVERALAESDGLTYTITSDVPAVTPTDLVAGGKPMGAKQRAHYTALPADLPAEVRATAQQVIDQAGARTEYAKARALQDWFRANFQYSLNPGLSDVGGPAITAFLHVRKGWCEQFAGTYAVMARALGMPTRIAVGFTPGRSDPEAADTFDVYGRQAHAWPEVWFPGQGWIAFEPTPGRGAPGATSYTGVPYQQDDAQAGPPGTLPPVNATQDPSGSQATPTTAVPAPATSRAAPVPKAANPAEAGDHGGVTALAVIVIVIASLLALLLAVLGALALTRWWLRLRRRRAARTAAQQVGVAWEEACDALTLVAPAPQPAETWLEYAERVRARCPESAVAAVDRLAALATAATWSDAASPEERAEAAQLADQIRRAVHEELGVARRTATALRPTTLRELAKRS